MVQPSENDSRDFQGRELSSSDEGREEGALKADPRTETDEGSPDSINLREESILKSGLGGEQDQAPSSDAEALSPLASESIELSRTGAPQGELSAAEFYSKAVQESTERFTSHTHPHVDMGDGVSWRLLLDRVPNESLFGRGMRVSDLHGELLGTVEKPGDIATFFKSANFVPLSEYKSWAPDENGKYAPATQGQGSEVATDDHPAGMVTRYQDKVVESLKTRFSQFVSQLALTDERFNESQLAIGHAASHEDVFVQLGPKGQPVEAYFLLDMRFRLNAAELLEGEQRSDVAFDRTALTGGDCKSWALSFNDGCTLVRAPLWSDTNFEVAPIFNLGSVGTDDLNVLAAEELYNELATDDVTPFKELYKEALYSASSKLPLKDPEFDAESLSELTSFSPSGRIEATIRNTHATVQFVRSVALTPNLHSIKCVIQKRSGEIVGRSTSHLAYVYSPGQTDSEFSDDELGFLQ